MSDNIFSQTLERLEKLSPGGMESSVFPECKKDWVGLKLPMKRIFNLLYPEGIQPFAEIEERNKVLMM